MIASDVLRAAIFCVLPFATSAGMIVVLAALAGVGTGLFRPAVYAGLPNLVEDRDLPAANGLIQSVENLTWAIGPLLGGALVAAAGPDPAYWVNAATFLLSALLLIRIPGRRFQAGTAVSHGHWRDLLEGFSFVLRSRALLTVLIVWNVFMLASAGINVAEVFLAKDTFAAGDFGYGLLVGATGLGLVLGSLAAGPLLESHPVSRVYPGSILLVALAVGAGCDRTQHLDRGRLRAHRGRRERHGGRLQRPVRPAGLAGRAARARLHRAHELVVRGVRTRDGRLGAADGRSRPALGLGRGRGLRSGLGPARAGPVARNRSRLSSQT